MVGGNTVTGGELGTRCVCHGTGRATLWQPTQIVSARTKMFQEIDGMSHLCRVGRVFETHHHVRWVSRCLTHPTIDLLTEPVPVVVETLHDDCCETSGDPRRMIRRLNPMTDFGGRREIRDEHTESFGGGN